MDVHVTIRYVDGTQTDFDASEWSSQRADGVDTIRVVGPSGLSAISSGHSLYWCYPESDYYVLGSASPYSAIPQELLVRHDRIDARVIDYMPDIEHHCVKLGWWRPGEDRP